MKNHHDHCDHDHSDDKGKRVRGSRADDHDHGAILKEKPGRAFQISIVFNLIFVVIQFYYGYVSQSLALAGDALHNLGDVFALALSWLGFYLASSSRSEKLSFGFKKFSILAAFFNSATLILTSLFIIFEAYERFRHPEPQNSVVMMVVSGLGFVVNLSTALLFHKGHQHDLNVKSAYLHLLGDALVSLGVVAAGALIYFFRVDWLDPLVSVLISVVILMGTWGLLKEAVVLLLNGVPQQINYRELHEFVKGYPGVNEVTELRVWALSTSEFTMTAKIKGQFDRAKLQKKISDEFNIEDSTIQVD